MAHPRTLKLPYIFGLGALLTIIGVLILAGCYLSRTTDQATASDVNNQSFTFANGAVFDAALVSLSTTLCFTDNATQFSLASSSKKAAGASTVQGGVCTLTIANSNYDVGTGPQVGGVITLDPCDFNSDLKTLTVSNRGLTTTSTAAVAGCQESSGVIPATADNVDNQSFTFSTPPSGEVFNVRLENITTTLAFTDNATNFNLTSVGSISGTATGTSTVQNGVCTLTIASSTYAVGDGPQAGGVIRLNPCNYDSNARKLTVTNNSVTVTSDTAVVVTTP